MVNKKNDNQIPDSAIFFPEKQILTHGKEVLENGLKDPQTLLSEYKALLRQFEKSVHQTDKIFRLSDHSQKNLIHTNEQVLIRNNELSQQIEKSKIFINLGENIACLIHNMKSDLSNLSISLGILEEQCDNPAIEFIKNGKNRLEQKITNILTLARYSQNDEYIDFSINALLDSLIELFSINSYGKRIKIKKIYNDDLYMNGNTSEISQVFENLFMNAHEAMIENWKLNKKSDESVEVPLLTLGTDRKGHEGIISFTDNGPGIRICLTCNSNDQCIDCDAFKIGQTEKTSGTGLGMISVFRTVKKYNGKVKINTSASGSTISVTLPFLAEKKNI
ncbi:MAG: HAMP domain-containing histidine kinase [Spirochaetaceae bacterium]|nr:HAMP domain-containing histidine kinase [Spirochaetaceae bacterium]